MFQENDKVVYGNYGVCVVTETNALLSLAGGPEREYYVLLPTRNKGSKVYLPTDRKESMRHVISHEEALEIIDTLDSIQIDGFKDSNSHTVEDHFRKLLRTHSCADALRVAKTMRHRIREQEAKKHLPSSMYTRLLDQANLQVRSELCAALNLEDAQLDSFIADRSAVFEI